jgi:hypothetical protein
MSLVAKSLFDLRDSDLTGQAQIFAVRAFLACRELPAGIACPNAIALHIPMVARRETR